MQQLIIYLQDNNIVAIITPNHDVLQKYGIHAIARKDVPKGKPYKIIDASDIPTDRSQREAWTVDVSDLTDGIGDGV